MWNRRMTTVAMASALALATASAVTAQDELPPAVYDSHPMDEIVSRTTEVEGRSYQDWINEYGSWFFYDTTPDTHPGRNKDCNLGQPGGAVFFLPHAMFGEVAHYQCTIGSDQHILMWLGGGPGFVIGDGATRDSALEDWYRHPESSYGFEFVLDGARTPIGDAFAFHPEFVTVDLAEDNFFGLPPGPRDTFIAGTFVMIEPLEVGDHRMSTANKVFSPQWGHEDARAYHDITVVDPAMDDA